MDKLDCIDNLDRRILSIVMHNARIPSKDVAQVCGVSRAAIHQRIQRMIELGIITGSGYTVNKKIQMIPGVTGTETLISLDNSIMRQIPLKVDEPAEKK